MKINTISPDNNNFLQIISTIAVPPKRLYFIGKLPDTRGPAVAIVGSRKPTVYGTEVTYRLAYDLAKKGVIIISGLALGTDAIAHRGALDAGGITIAVLAGGLDRIYPRSNHQLSDRIIKQGGALISENTPDDQLHRASFLQRNRIISGLSDAVIVTEAATRSGTLSTVAHALEQNREVFAVPGNITSPLSTGPNKLLTQGAHPVTSVDDVLSVIAPALLKSQSQLALGSNHLQATIIQLIQAGVRDGDELLDKSGASTSEFLQELTMMELDNLIRPLGGNQWTLG